MTKKRIMGVIPKIEHDLPEEDSLVGSSSSSGGGTGRPELPQESWNWQIDLIAKAIKESTDIERMLGIAGLA